MRFLMMYKPEKMTPPSPEHIAAIGKLIDDATKAGVMLATGGLHPSSDDARVRLSGGKLTVTDGPFTESKELIGGFALIEAKSREEALKMAKDFLKVAGDGESDVRLVS